MQIYSGDYSFRVVDNFWRSAGRGCRHLERLWPVLTKLTAIEFFRRDQVRWNIYKKLAKLADRLLTAGHSEDLVNLNMVTSVKYFRKIAEKELEEYKLRRSWS